MNAKRIMLWAFCVLSTLLVACTSEEDGAVISQDNPQETSLNEWVLRSFRDKYPEVDETKVVWSESKEYYVANFEHNSKSARAWFTESGEWLQYKANFSFNTLPESIRKNFVQSDFAEWKIDHAELLERDQMGDVYIVEAYKGLDDYNIYYSDKGDFLKAIAKSKDNSETPVIVPASITKMMKNEYKGATIYDLLKDNFGYEVGFVEENIYKTLLLDNSGEWLCTMWDLTNESIPEQIIRGFENSKYSANTVQKIQMMVKERNEIRNNFYLFYVTGIDPTTGNDKNYIVTFNNNGSVDIAISA